MTNNDVPVRNQWLEFELPQIHETRLDGVRTVWVETDGPLSAVLMFRVGMVDETPTTRGITHLVEHLALASLHTVAHPYQGTTELTHTVFSAAGPPDDIAAFLQKVAAGLVDLPLDRLDLEARVLMAESMNDRASVWSSMLAHRFGPRGPGLVAYPEYGLRRLDADEVSGWAEKYFTADNAVLILTGPPPEGLRLPLPRGNASPLPSWPDDGLPDEPTNVVEQDGGASLLVFGERTTPFRLAADVVQHRLETRLRHELGRVYAVNHQYMAIAPNEAAVIWGADSDPAHAVEVAEVLANSVAEMAAHGPSQDELEHLNTKSLNEARLHPNMVKEADVHWRGTSLLLGDAYDGLVNTMVARAEADPAEVANALERPASRAIAAFSADADTGFAPPPLLSDQPIDGRTFRWKQNKHHRLVVGRDAVAYNFGDEWSVLRYDRLAVAEHVDATSRMLLDERGTWVGIDVTEWRSGKRLLDAIDAAVPASVVIPATR